MPEECAVFNSRIECIEHLIGHEKIEKIIVFKVHDFEMEYKDYIS